MWKHFITIHEHIGYFWVAVAGGESLIEGILFIQSYSSKAVEIWMAWPTAPPCTWNLNRPGVFIERLFLAHRLWHCRHAQSRHKHIHTRSSETSCHSLLACISLFWAHACHAVCALMWEVMQSEKSTCWRKKKKDVLKAPSIFIDFKISWALHQPGNTYCK